MVTTLNTVADDPQKAPDATPLIPPKKAWLTREESAHLLGVSVQTIKNYEKKGKLHPKRQQRTGNGREQVVVVHDPQALSVLNQALKAKSRHDASDTSEWLTRNASADMLNVSTQTLKNYERQGKLHPIRARREDARGHEQSVVVYDPKEVARIPRGIGRFSTRLAGEIEARCYELFEQGKSYREIVIALRETSDRVHDLYDRWLDDEGAALVVSGALKSALENMLGPFKDVTELVEIITAKVGGKPTSSIS